MKTKQIERASFFTCIIIFALAVNVNAQEVKDQDGNVYKTAKHGVQVWTASNLNVSHFRNGDLIPEAKTDEEWANAASSGSPAWCYYENNPENGAKYGKLYNWYAINDTRGLAPEGWHIPENADWRLLIKNLLGIKVAGPKLKDKEGWKNQKGTNDIGFTALPAGCRDTDGKFKDFGKICRWWSNSVPVDVKPSPKIYSVSLNDNTSDIKYIESDKGAGLSVRCEKD